MIVDCFGEVVDENAKFHFVVACCAGRESLICGGPIWQTWTNDDGVGDNDGGAGHKDECVGHKDEGNMTW